MEKEELKQKIYEIVERSKGKKKLKEKDVIAAASEETGVDRDTVKKALREMIDVGKLMYSYTGGASSVEIPSEEYLREKGLL
jgi:putative NADH-flavin reductase